MTHHPLTKTGNPPVSQLETRQYRGLIEQYELYLASFWEAYDANISQDRKPLGIQQFYDSAMFELPPTEKQLLDFNRALMQFYNAGIDLVAKWPHEIEMCLDRKKVEACLTMSFDEWIAEFVTILPENQR